MHTKRAGFALLAAALLIAVVGSVVSANVLRVGMTDYEVYPCTYNANAGYYVPWDGNAAGQFWISAPVWEWGGEGGALCADSDGDWRDNGVRDGDPNPNFGDEYRRAQSAVNARQAAFSASLVSLAEQIERGIREEAERIANGGDPARPGSPPVQPGSPQLQPLAYSAALNNCDDVYDATVEPLDPNDRAGIDAALAALGQCRNTAIENYPAEARSAYSQLQTRCRELNPVRAGISDVPYQACVSAGELGSQGAETGAIVLPVFDPETGTTTNMQVPIVFKECTDVRRDADGGVGCNRRNVRNSMGNLVLDSDGNPVQELVTDGQKYYPTRVTYTTRIPNPEITLNPSPTPDPAATPDPTPDTSDIPSCDFAQRWMNDIGDNLDEDAPNEQVVWRVIDGGDGRTYSYGADYDRFDNYIWDNC